METNEREFEKTGGKKSKSVVVLAICVACLLVVNIGLVVFQVITATAAQKADKKVSQFIDDERERQAKELEGEAYQEDGYSVGGQYEIKSTTAISDAYKSNDNSQLNEQEVETLKLASDVIKEVVKDNMSDYEKEVAVYDWMCKNISTSEGGSISVPGVNTTEAVSTPYGVLTGKQAVCVGYATTFRLLMNMLGIDCHIVHNDYHSWDLVQIGEHWYHVDIYSDSSSGNYANFNMSDSMARNGHEWNDKGALPVADSYEYCYAYQNAVETKDINTIPKTVYSATYGVRENAAFYFNIGAYDATKSQRVSIMAEIMNQVFESGMDDNLSGKYIDCSLINVDENTTIVCYSLTDSRAGEGGEGEMSYDEIYQEMLELINKTFKIDFAGGYSG